LHAPTARNLHGPEKIVRLEARGKDDHIGFVLTAVGGYTPLGVRRSTPWFNQFHIVLEQDVVNAVVLVNQTGRADIGGAAGIIFSRMS